jgi:hypothetical protein
LLKSSLAKYEDIKTRLSVEKERKGVEIAQIEALDKQSQAEYRQVQRYTAMIDAISRKADISEKQLKQVESQGRVFELNIEKAKATHDIYLAGLEGDTKLFEGRLTPLKVIEEQLKADNQNIQSQQLILDAVAKRNSALISSFDVEKDAYKLEAEIALQKFNALMRIKELGEDVYKNEIQNAITQFSAEFDTAWKQADLKTKVYQLSVDTAFKESDLFMRFKQILVDSMKLPIDVYGQSLSSAYSAMSATLAKTVEAAA